MDYVPDFFREQFWLPLPFTALLVIWSWIYTYPVYLEKRIRDKRSPKLWIYIPKWWQGVIKALASPISMLLLFISAYLWIAALSNLTTNKIILALVFIICCGILFILRHFAMKQHYVLQRECYFHDYKRIAYEAHTRGKSPSEVELKNLCMYEHQQNMRKADQSGRLKRYLKVKAKSEKEVNILDDNLE
ncbi:MAG: hypothetical protein GX801_01785 [Fibrobacter sp.]|nr:hypothetical protein [Fibrobacter sp.]